MDPSQGPVERKAHGARMPTEPPHSPHLPHLVLDQREDKMKKITQGNKEEIKRSKSWQIVEK